MFDIRQDIFIGRTSISIFLLLAEIIHLEFIKTKYEYKTRKPTIILAGIMRLQHIYYVRFVFLILSSYSLCFAKSGHHAVKRTKELNTHITK